jgi:NAD(P)H-dependent FMN reductase
MMQILAISGSLRFASSNTMLLMWECEGLDFGIGANALE